MSRPPRCLLHSFAVVSAILSRAQFGARQAADVYEKRAVKYSWNMQSIHYGRCHVILIISGFDAFSRLY
jgi:hypothetical protein